MHISGEADTAGFWGSWYFPAPTFSILAYSWTAEKLNYGHFLKFHLQSPFEESLRLHFGSHNHNNNSNSLVTWRTHSQSPSTTLYWETNQFKMWLLIPATLQLKTCSCLSPISAFLMNVAGKGQKQFYPIPQHSLLLATFKCPQDLRTSMELNCTNKYCWTNTVILSIQTAGALQTLYLAQVFHITFL